MVALCEPVFVTVKVDGTPVTVGAANANAGDETTRDDPITAAPPTPSFFSAFLRSIWFLVALPSSPYSWSRLPGTSSEEPGRPARRGGHRPDG
jgi:hypothetical protein